MAIVATQTRRVTDEMFIEAARAVADQLTPEQRAQGLLYPLQSNILEIEIKTTAKVAKLVFDSGLASVERPADLETFIRHHVYKPDYSPLVWPILHRTAEGALAAGPSPDMCLPVHWLSA